VSQLRHRRELGDGGFLGEVITHGGTAFFCLCCAVTVSCLPDFAQPYRVVCNLSIERFFQGRINRIDVRCWRELLSAYRRGYQRWFKTLRMECGALFGRSPPEEKPESFWHRIMRTCGGCAPATGKLVSQLRVTLFGRYRCHQRRIFRAESGSC
jgi:hypothetical protein